MTTLSRTRTITYEVISCGSCQVTFALDQAWIADLKRSSTLFYCPNGDKISYNNRDQVQELEHQLAAEKRRLEWARRDAAHAEQTAERERRSAAAQKGHATRLRKRAANGVCPCCKRTFVQLQRHMAGQHPDFVAAVS